MYLHNEKKILSVSQLYYEHVGLSYNVSVWFACFIHVWLLIVTGVLSYIESGIYILEINNVDVSGDVGIVSEVVEILLNS